MLMQHCFMGSSSLETIGELPEDGSCSDRDALINDSSRNDVYGMKGPYLINNTPREKPTTKKDIDMNNNMGNSTNNVSQLQFDAENDFNNSKEAVNGIADGDSTSSRHTFTSSLRQDLTPSPSCSYGSEDSISDDDYGDFQIQTFPLDNITHGETTSSSLQSHSNVWSRHVVFDINDEQNVSSVMKSYTTPPTESGDKCVHIEVFHTPPIKPTTTQKKTLNSCRSPRQKAREHHNKESQMKQESEKTHKNILPLKSEQVQEKNDADMLEMKKEHKKILAKFSFDDNGVNESELENDNNIMKVCIHLSAVKQDVYVDGDKKEEQYTLSKTTNGLTKAKLFSTPEKSTPPSAHTFVTEEHELKPEESQVIASLPGSTCISEEAPSIKQDPSVYNEAQSSNKYDSSSHSRTKTDSFQSVLHRLKSLVNADNYLPKCSHYSSHDRALKHAGYSLKELDAKLVTEAGAHKDDTKTKHKTTAVTPKSAWSSPNKKKGRRNIFGRKSSSDISRDEYERILDGRRGSYGVIVKGVNGKNKLKQAKDKSILEFKQNMKNTKRIAAYLSLVKQYPEQYQDLKQTAKKPQEVDGRLQVSQTLINMGEAYQRSNSRGTPESLVLQAAYELGHNHLLPVCAKHEKQETTRINKMIKDANKSKRGSLRNVRISVKKGDEVIEKVSKVQKSHVELEIWLKTLTTVQMLKARELALKQMGESEHTMRKWWVTQKYCRYLRQPYNDDEITTLENT